MLQKSLTKRIRYCFATAAIVMLAGQTKAQGYHSMLGKLTEWYVTYCSFGTCLHDYYQAYGDTLVKGEHYYFLDKYHYNRHFLIREDTVSGRVFMYLAMADTSLPKDEILMYDFSLQQGDTAHVQNPIAPAPADAGGYLVDSTRMESFAGISRKVLYLSALDTSQSGFANTQWIEGIGSRSLINTPGAGPQLYGIGSLSCFFKDGVRLLNDPANHDSCESRMGEFMNLEDQYYTRLQVQVFPTVFNDQLQVYNPLKQEVQFYLYSHSGQRLSNETISPATTKTISLSNQPPGMYIARTGTADGSGYRSFQLIKF